MYRIRKTFKFEASHVLYGLPEGHKCGTLPSHGHSYKIELFLESGELDETGFVVDFGELKEFKERYIDHPKGVDHSFLNTKISSMVGVGEWYPEQTSAENLAKLFYILARQMYPQVVMVRVHETETGYAEYWEDEDDEFSNNFNSYGDLEGEIIEDFILQEL